MAEASPTVKHGKAGLTVPEIFASASPFAVERAARRLRSRLRHDRWLASTNIYLHQAPGVVRGQFEHLGKPQAPVVLAAGTLEASQLAESIAASTILHCADGWSYLGRAMAAQLRGDSSTSRHLAYYAELRAAASLLASQGIGMFAGPHVILKESNDIEIFRQYGTHQFAWLALAQWTDLPQSVDLLGSVIQPADAALADWLVPSVEEASGRKPAANTSTLGVLMSSASAVTGRPATTPVISRARPSARTHRRADAPPSSVLIYGDYSSLPEQPTSEPSIVICCAAS